MKRTLRHLLLLLGLATLIPHAASARTIIWGSAVGDTLIDSTGAPLDGGFTFELGTFGSGFVPTQFNTTDWYTNWKVFDRSVTGTTWYPALPDQFLASEATLNTDYTSSSPFSSATFATGERAYIWVYDSQLSASTSEWALISGSATGPATDTAWFIPTPTTSHDPDTLDWRFDTSSSLIYGGLNNAQGPGEYTFAPGAFVLQTHAAPEPGPALLCGLAFMLHLTRTRQRR